MAKKVPISKPISNVTIKLPIKPLSAIGVVVIIAIAVFIVFGNNNNAAPLPHLAATNNVTPTQISSALSQSGTAMAMMSSLTESKINSTGRFKIDYSGTLKIKPAGIIGTLASINSPINVSISKNLSAKQLYISLSETPLNRALYTSWKAGSTETQICTNYNATALGNGNLKVFLTSQTSSCKQGNNIGPVDLSKLYNFDFSFLQNLGLVLTYKNSYQSELNGLPCTVVNASLSQFDAKGVQTEKGYFEMCVSNKYYVPLLIAMNLSGKSGAGSIIISEYNISSNAFPTTTQ